MGTGSDGIEALPLTDGLLEDELMGGDFCLYKVCPSTSKRLEVGHGQTKSVNISVGTP